MESNKVFFVAHVLEPKDPPKYHSIIDRFTPTKKISNSSIDTDVGFGKSRDFL